MKEALIPVTRPEQAERMRIIRNACREFMTNDQHEITAAEQRRWFELIKDSRVMLPFLYKPLPDRRLPEPFGFGLIRKKDDKWWLTGGLLPDWRGKGYGIDLFTELADYVHARGDTAWLTVWESNVRARKTYESIGFTVESVFVDAHAPPILIMNLLPRPLRKFKLTCPLCGIVTNQTRGPRSTTGQISEHGDCLGAGAIVTWMPVEIQ